MHGTDINASIHGANESMNNVVNDKEQRTTECEAVGRLQSHTVHGEASFIPDRLYQQIFKETWVYFILQV